MAPPPEAALLGDAGLITVQAARVSAQWPICDADWWEPRGDRTLAAGLQRTRRPLECSRSQPNPSKGGTTSVYSVSTIYVYKITWYRATGEGRVIRLGFSSHR